MPQSSSGSPSRNSNGNGATLGFEETLWKAADTLRGQVDAAEYKHVVLGLIFLKYISDAFAERFSALQREPYANPEDRDEYTGAGVFWVPPEARWLDVQAKAKLPEIVGPDSRRRTIGRVLDDAMLAIERDNPALKNVLPRDYARSAVSEQRIAELIDLIGTIGLGDAESRSQDILGRVYEYFLGKFASSEGKGGGEFYTPRSVVQLLVEMLEPYHGRVYDPCCGSGGMFVQSERFVQAHGGRIGDIAIYGQESNATTWRLCKMNLAIRGIEVDLGEKPADTFHDDQHPDLRADFILANPPFNVSEWGGQRLREDTRWRFAPPPAGNANFAWVQHIISHLTYMGHAGFVLANGSMSSNQSGEGDIRRAIVEADLVDCMVALPPQLFYSTQIPACLWFLARSKAVTSTRRGRPRETLFIDARKLGSLIDRTHRELAEEEIARIAATYHAWRGEPGAGSYEDIPGFCKSATTDEIAAHGYVLTPGRYVGAEEVEDDGEPFAEKLARLTATLEQQFAESAQLEALIRQNLKGLGYGE
jgi:type I restriction enzyme M protein